MTAPAAGAVPRHDPYAALRIPNFRWFIASVLAMTVATQMQAVVVGWQIYDVTHDPLSLGLVGLAEALPFITIALFAGHVADLRDRRRIALAALIVMLGCSAALLAFTLRSGIIADGRVWPIYAVIFVSGIARSFLQPARQALGAELVPRALYPNAVAWRSSTWQLAAVFGPALGGLLYGFSSIRTAYGADVALMAVGLAALARVRHASTPVPAETGAVFERLSAGVRFVRAHAVLLGALTLDLFSVLFGGATALLPIFAADILRVGPQGLGVLRAAPSAGAVVMSLLLAHRPPVGRAGRALLTNVGLFGLSIVGFGLSRNFALSVLLLAIGGAVDMVSVVIRSTMVQVMTPEPLLGRVSSVNQIFIGSSNEIGAFESGVAARLIGTVPAVVAGGAVTLAVVALTAWRVPSLRRLGEIK
ncbi:MAG TPA: MFS transporter [Gemmatimonadales bacterium]|nr:MFS transporter [Gemmatimonadales bacterium]